MFFLFSSILISITTKKKKNALKKYIKTNQRMLFLIIYSIFLTITVESIPKIGLLALMNTGAGFFNSAIGHPLKVPIPNEQLGCQIVTLASDLHSLKAWLPIVLTDLGIETSFIISHLLKAKFPIDKTELGISIVSNFLQPKKDSFPIFFTELGISTFSKFSHSLKASSPISFTFEGIFISFKALHLLKVELFISFTDSGISNEDNEEQPLKASFPMKLVV